MSANIAQIHCMVVMIEYDYWKTLLSWWRKCAKLDKQRRIYTKYLNYEIYQAARNFDCDIDDDMRRFDGEDEELVHYGIPITYNQLRAMSFSKYLLNCVYIRTISGKPDYYWEGVFSWTEDFYEDKLPYIFIGEEIVGLEDIEEYNERIAKYGDRDIFEGLSPPEKYPGEDICRSLHYNNF
jgi:hypothetical protein